MNEIREHLLKDLFKTDLLILKNNNVKSSLTLSIRDCSQLIRMLKQFIFVLKDNKKLPLFFISSNKQYTIFLKKFLKKKNDSISCITIKDALIVKVPAIFIILEDNISVHNILKIYDNSFAIIILVNKRIEKKYTQYYKIDFNVEGYKAILFLIAVIKTVFC